MNYIKLKISKKKDKAEEGGVIVLRRLTILGFLPKFLILGVQAILGRIYKERLFLG